MLIMLGYFLWFSIAFLISLERYMMPRTAAAYADPVSISVMCLNG